LVCTQYNWAGQPIVSVTKQEKSGAPAQTTIVVSKMTYDDLGRLLQVDNKVQNTNVNSNALPASYTTVVKNEYDALGQIKKKKVGNMPAAPAGTPLENINYEYNIRGWSIGVNRAYLTAASNHYFGYELAYNNPQSIISATSYGNLQYQGNITGTIWRSAGDGMLRAYDFVYDKVDRLMRADFTQFTGGYFNKNAGVDFSSTMGDGINPASAYDANGNIIGMLQKGLKLNTFTKLGDFKDGANG
jgi:hypothetical protein